MAGKPQGFWESLADAVWALLVFVFRYATGQHLDGRRRSDATVFKDGTKDGTDPTHWSRSPWWPRLAMWKRAVIRDVAAAAGWALLIYRAAALRASAVILGAVLGCGIIRGIRWREEWHHYRTRVRPLAYALAGVLGQPVEKPRLWLAVPQDYATREDAEVVIDVPHGFTGSDRDMEDITRAVTAKLGFPNPEAEQKLRSHKPQLIYRHQQPPPPDVSLADIRPYIDAAKPSQIILGLAKKREVVDLDLDSETPMVAASMTTGDGKSEFAKNMAAQLLYHGAIVMILDYKLVSHMWAEQLPNVCYARTPAEIHRALMWLGWDECDAGGNVIVPSELTRRKQVHLAARRRGEESGLTRLFVLMEERNATGRILKRHWRRIGGKGASPALEALDETGETGRGVKVNKLDIAQRLSAKASGSDGSADARENIGAIFTKDATEATWKMLAAGHAQPPRSGHKGRYQMIQRRGVTDYQGVLYSKDPDESDAMARELAMAGTVAVPRWDMPFVNRGGLLVPAGMGQDDHARQEGPEQPVVIGQSQDALPSGAGPRTAVTLAEAVAAGLFVSIAAARKARHRQGWEPVAEDPVRGHQYALTDIYAYVNKGKR